MSRIKPLPADATPDLKETMETYRHHLGYVPNSPLVLARRPKIVKALAQMASAVWDKETSEVNLGFKRLVAYLASRTHGCNYSMAHAAEAAHRLGESDARDRRARRHSRLERLPQPLERHHGGAARGPCPSRSARST